MWRSRQLFQVKILGKLWEGVLPATIWTIWLVRNELSFHNKTPNLLQTIQLIKFKSLSWGLALGIILRDKIAWWESNPSGVAVASLRVKWFCLLNEEKCLAVALIDGSWKSGKHFSKRGIGGLVKSVDGSHLLEFAGPVRVQSAFHDEVQALLQLSCLLATGKWEFNKILILTDSTRLIEEAEAHFLSKEWEELKSRTSLRHINRVFNVQADSLAKHGACMDKLWVKWASPEALNPLVD